MRTLLLGKRTFHMWHASVQREQLGKLARAVRQRESSLLRWAFAEFVRGKEEAQIARHQEFLGKKVDGWLKEMMAS